MGTVKYTEGLPKIKSSSALVIYDRRLLRFGPFKKWIQSFPNKLAVTAGEGLKDLEHFPVYVKKALKSIEGQSVKNITVVAVGGGSVGDFAGFMASILKRGVRLVHIPTTWLAAMDSSHGGKTALNVGSLKNQIGTFYAASEIHISRKLLSTQSSTQLKSAYGELFKIALINGGELAQKLFKLKALDEKSLWGLLPMAIRAKMKVVNADPLEKNKTRYLLNLGHSFGHALELEHKLPHGEAVLYGTLFAMKWSLHKKWLSQKKYDLLVNSLLVKPKSLKKLNAKKLSAAVAQDKKSAGNSQLHFVFPEGPGKCRLEKVKISELVIEAKRQGWV